MKRKTYISYLILVLFVIPYLFQSSHELQHKLDKTQCSHHHDHSHDKNESHHEHGLNISENCYVCDFEFVKFTLPEITIDHIEHNIQVDVISFASNNDQYFYCCNLLQSLRAPPVVMFS